MKKRKKNQCEWFPCGFPDNSCEPDSEIKIFYFPEENKKFTLLPSKYFSAYYLMNL